jgi:hypothetical protein
MFVLDKALLYYQHSLFWKGCWMFPQFPGSLHVPSLIKTPRSGKLSLWGLGSDFCGTLFPVSVVNNCTSCYYTNSSMLNHVEIRDCALLATAVYLQTEVQIRGYLARRGHRFSEGITCSNLANNEGHFVIARSREENRTTTYLAVRGSFVLEDWGANVQAWPTLQEMGMVHAGWYARMLHLPQHLLLQCVKDGHRVVICGHSLGGAVAQLLTLSMLQSFAGYAAETEIRTRIKCVSFGGPMVLSGSVAVDHVNNHFKDNFVNFVHSKDIVPKILSFAQAALKDLTSQASKQRSVFSLVKMLRMAVDPTANGGLTADILRAGTAALLESTAVRVALAYRPIGHYYKIDGPPATPLSPQTVTELEELVAWSSVELSTNAVHAHNMETVYLTSVLSRLNADASGNIVLTATARLQLPQPVIHRVDLHRAGERILVRIFGAHLYMVKKVTSSILPLCSLDHRVSSTALVAAEQLVFIVDPLPTNYARQRAMSATTVAQLMVDPGLCWTNAIQFLSVPVRIVDTHPMDLFSLQELIMVATYLLLFVSREKNHYDHPKFSMLRKLLVETLATVPLPVYFSSPSPIIGYCVEKHPDKAVPVLFQHPATRAALTGYINQGEAVYDTLRDQDEAQALREHLDDLKHRMAAQGTEQNSERQPHNILSLLAMCHNPPLEGQEGGLQVLLEVLGGPLHHARAALSARLTTETYHTFLGALAVGLNSTNELCVDLGTYYNPAQTELGPLYDALAVFLNNPTVRVAMGMMIGGGIVGRIFLSSLFTWVWAAGSAFNPVMLVVYIGLVLSGQLLLDYVGKFPGRVLGSSAGLRDSMLLRLGVNVAEGATVGEKEAALATNLRVRCGFGPFDNADDLRQLVSLCFPSVRPTTQQYPHVLCRLKLTVLCDALRTTLRQLPVALVTGPTRSGKTTFREYMQTNGPDFTKFGPGVRQRTSVPELFFCGEPDRPVGLLDSIGLGDPTNDKVFAAIEQANQIFRSFCQVSIIVVNESDKSTAGRHLMHHTSAVPPKADMPGATPVLHPTITCFTNADRMLGMGGVFPAGEDGPATLLQEARDRVVRDEPFDLRSPQEDTFAPRVLACFEGRLCLPEEYNGVLYTTTQVREWLCSHFYPTAEI